MLNHARTNTMTRAAAPASASFNPHEAYWRHVKAEALATAAESLRLQPDDLLAVADRQWVALAEIALCKPPSAETQTLVVGIMRLRMAVRARIAAMTEEELFARFAD